jgi:hypothetical protein
MLKCYETGTMPATLPVHTQTFDIGNWKLVALSREATTEFGLAIRQLWQDRMVSVIAYTNDVSSYLATDPHIVAKDYEGYGSSFWYGQPSPFPLFRKVLSIQSLNIIKTIHVLIADSGSTKTDWCLADGNRMIEFRTAGYHPYYSSGEELVGLLLPKLPEGFDLNEVDQVAFYGAGVYEEKQEQIQEVMGRVFPHAAIHAAMDLVGSARALLGRQPGFAAILGTGTNSCMYDGRKITHNIDSLGFFLGDEGSGGYMGKRLIGDYIRGYMPEVVRRQFSAKHP